MRQVRTMIFLIVALTLAFSAVSVSAKTKLVWWSPDPPDISEPYKKIAREFEKLHPDIKVDVQLVPEEGYLEKLLTSFAAGNSPDIYFNFDLLGIGRRGMAVNLDKLAERDGFDFGIYPEEMLKRWLTIDETHYALPRDVGLVGVFYNRKVFDEAGVAYPEPDWDLNDFLVIAKKVTNREKHIYAIASIGGEPILRSFGATWFSDDFRTIKTDTPEFANYVKWRMDLELKHKVLPTQAEMAVLGGGGGGALDFFKTGRLAMVQADYWGVAIFKQAGMDFGVVPVPQSRDIPPVVEGWLGAWSISPQSKDIQAAWELLKFICGPEGARIMADAWAIPAVTSLHEEWVKKDPRNAVFVKMMQYEPWNSWYVQVPDPWNVTAPIYDVFSILREGKMGAEQALAEATAEAQKKLDRAWAEVERK